MRFDPHAINGNLYLERLHRPSLDLAQFAQPIGYAAWRGAIGVRTDDELRRVFNSDDPARPAALLKEMTDGEGQFVGVKALVDERPVGYAWALGDLDNDDLPVQYAKLHKGELSIDKPVTLTAQLNVDPYYQGTGIGSAMLRELLEPLDGGQENLAFVLYEEPIAFGWLLERGFQTNPDTAFDPNARANGPDMLFGRRAEHALHWRLQAVSNLAVIDAINSRLDLPEHKVRDIE